MSLVVLLVGCENSESTTDSVSDKVKIVTTLFPQYDFARVIGGDKVDVKLLLPAGMESHSYEPTPADIIQINKADLFIYTGESMEQWAHSIIESVDSDSVYVLDVSKNVPLLEPNSVVEDEHNHEDEAEADAEMFAEMEDDE